MTQRRLARPLGGEYRPFRFLLAAFATLLLMVPPGSVRAASEFPAAFVVTDVPVDATAQTAVAAREAARVQGAATAFRTLLERLTAQSDWPRLPVLDGPTVMNMVVDFDVSHEQSSPVRYLANYTFRFNPKSVRDLLQRNGIASTELASKPVVVVPVLKEGDQIHLWDDPNPWRDAWNAVPGRYGIVPWIVPAGDLADVTALDAPDTGQPKPEQLQALAQHYDNGDVLVVIATQTNVGDGVHLDIAVTRYVEGGTPATGTTSVDGQKADPAFYRAGVAAASKVLEDAWKQQSFPAPSVASTDQTIDVNVPIAGPGDWARVQQRLANIPTIHSVVVDVMTRKSIRLKLAVSSDPAVLRVALAQQDLVLTQDSPTATLLFRSSAQPASLAAPLPAPGTE